MTVRNHPVRRISGIALLALFLTFVTAQVYPGIKDGPDDDLYDESRLSVSSGPAPAPVILRNNAKSLTSGGFLDKAAAQMLLSAPLGEWFVAITLCTAPKETIPPLVSNPFYVVLTANAP